MKEQSKARNLHVSADSDARLGNEILCNGQSALSISALMVSLSHGFGDKGRLDPVFKREGICGHRAAGSAPQTCRTHVHCARVAVISARTSMATRRARRFLALPTGTTGFSAQRGRTRPPSFL